LTGMLHRAKRKKKKEKKKQDSLPGPKTVLLNCKLLKSIRKRSKIF
jgi:hypothetical protein